MEKEFHCYVDASSKGIGGTLTQQHGNERGRVIEYYSRKFSKSEEEYTENEGELLG